MHTHVTVIVIATEWKGSGDTHTLLWSASSGLKKVYEVPVHNTNTSNGTMMSPFYAQLDEGIRTVHCNAFGASLDSLGGYRMLW